MKGSKTKNNTGTGFWLINAAFLATGLGFIACRIKNRIDNQEELNCVDSDYIALVSLSTLVGISFNTLYHNPVQMTDEEAIRWSSRFLPPTPPPPSLPLPTPQIAPEDHKNILEEIFGFILGDR